MKYSTSLVVLVTVLSRAAGDTAIATRCAGAVDKSTTLIDGKPGNCSYQLWNPTDDNPEHPAQDCYAYGGPDDPCALHNNNDKPNDGMDKDPSKCNYGSTFFLWDEPDTQGKSYAWAAESWITYSKRWSAQITSMREAGFKFTTPLFRTDNAKDDIKTFFEACGKPCLDKNSPSYIDVLALNVYCGTWNNQGQQPDVQSCREGIRWFWNDPHSLFIPLSATPTGQKWLDRPLFITNWARIDDGELQPDDQLAAMDATDEFFQMTSPSVDKVFWFGATNYMKKPDGQSVVVKSGNRMYDKLSSGKTLGEHWVQNVCSTRRLQIATPSSDQLPAGADIDRMLKLPDVLV